MVEYAIEDNLDPFFMAGCNEILQILVVTQTGVKLPVISSMFFTIDRPMEIPIPDRAAQRESRCLQMEVFPRWRLLLAA